MNAEAIVALVSLALGTLAWLFRQSSSVSKALVELGICKADVQKLQEETQTLRDQSVKQDTLVQTVMTQLSKLEKIDALVSSVDVMRAVVERLERRVDQRQGNDLNHLLPSPDSLSLIKRFEQGTRDSRGAESRLFLSYPDSLI